MKKISSVRTLLLIGLISVPALVLAQSAPQQLIKATGSIHDVVDAFTKNVVTALATLFATAAMVAFFFGLVQYIWGVRDGKPEKVKAGNQFMIWGLVALFVMFSVWGIVTMGQKLLGIDGQSTIVIPSIQIGGSGSSATTPSPSSAGLPTGTSPSSSSSADCTGKSEGSSCTISGRAGTCTTSSDESGARFGCYVTPTGGSPCTSNEIMTSTGCQAVNGF